MLQMQASYVACGFGKPANVRVLELLDRLQSNATQAGWKEARWSRSGGLSSSRVRASKKAPAASGVPLSTRVDTCRSPRKA